ncbi:MAG TPA: TPM domain-containing protein, partial [Thermoanaerobaculia bacterium]|nr:TPM domain-containing protein [Thermoanaerobaculia bacterium]
MKATSLPRAASPLIAAGLPSRPNDRAVHDLSKTLSPAAVADLERRADAVLRAGAAVAVLVRFHRSDSDDTRAAARRLLSEWEVEREAGRADGVAIVVNLQESDPNHGAAAIHVGRALRDGNLPPREVERIWRDEMRPALREGRVADCIATGLDAVARSLREGP